MPIEARPPSAQRVKRHVIAREHSFAVVAPPGLESVCREEMISLGLTGVDESASAAIEFKGRLRDLYHASVFLRGASRIWLRMGAFRAGAREELFRKTEALAWELWIPEAAAIRVDARVEYSRISHEGESAQTVFEAISRRLRDSGLKVPTRRFGSGGSEAVESPDEAKNPVEPGRSEGQEGGSLQRVFVHIEDDHVRLSLDSSGEHLHMRGWKALQGAAPIRENLAAALLSWAGWPRDFSNLVDGMSGSGTFALEAAGMASSLPAFGARPLRRFSFMDWPSFQEASFSWDLKNRIQGFGPKRIIAIEKESSVLELARANARTMLECGAVDPAIVSLDWRQGDFFGFQAEGGPGLLVLNPPYGERLSDENGELPARIARKIEASFRGWSALILGTEDEAHPGLRARLAAQTTIRHGGLRVHARLYRIPPPA